MTPRLWRLLVSLTALVVLVGGLAALGNRLEPSGMVGTADATGSLRPTTLRWAMKLDTEPGFDKVAVQWSKDGRHFSTLGTYSGRNDDDPGWSPYSAIMPASSGPIEVRFHVTTDSLCSALGGPLCASPGGYDGVHVDDVTLGTP